MTPRRHRIASRALGGDRVVRALVPAEPRALLLLADGANVFAAPRTRGSRDKWRAESAARAVPGLAIVAIDAGADRAYEYLPYPDPAVRRAARRYRADAFARFLVEELLPFLAGGYPALARARIRGVGGSSYGAVAALWAARTGAFSRLLVESVPPWIGDGRLLADVAAAPAPARAWVGAGTAESRRADVSAAVAGGARELSRILRDRGARVRLRIDEGARHDERAWARRLPDALRFLFLD